MMLVPALHHKYHNSDTGIEFTCIFYSSVASVTLPVSNQSGCQIFDDKNTILTSNRDFFLCDAHDARDTHGSSFIIITCINPKV